MKITFKLLLLSILLGSSGCAAIFIPGKQKITFNTDNDKSVVYVNKEEVATGKSSVSKIKKSGTKQVVIQTPDHLDQHHVMVPGKIAPAVYPLVVLDVAACFYPVMVDFLVQEKFRSYDKVQHFNIQYPYKYRTDDQKYIRLTNIEISIAYDEEDFKTIYVKHDKDIIKAMEESEKDQDILAAEQKAKDEKRKKKNKKSGNILEEENKGVNYENTKFSQEVWETLKKTGYVDTVNKVFQDEANTILLSGNITDLKLYRFSAKRSNYVKLGTKVTWYIKNAYNEILDSVTRMDYSGEYSAYWLDGDQWEKMIQEAMNYSYNNLLDEGIMSEYLKKESDATIEDEVLALNNPSSFVNEVKESVLASVIVKREDGGHGSGFAITNDGYILTNYHVISGDYDKVLPELSIILEDGTEVEVEVVRYNKMKDIALLKVDYQFKKAFKLNETKEFSKLLDVYTIGAPKSIELGQSVTKGLISNERNSHNNKMLQLSMAVNPGNSGGPLFEKSGILHGVIKSKLVGLNTEGVSFAIPSYMINEYLNISFK